MDEKNANGEINANESVKQLSDSDAQSVESAAEAREFDVVTEKPAQRQEKKTKNAAKRPSGKQRSETTQVVTKTAVRTDRKSTRLNSSHNVASRMPSSA